MSNNLTEICLWRLVHDVDKLKRERGENFTFEQEGICKGCRGYETSCKFYTPNPLDKKYEVKDERQYNR